MLDTWTHEKKMSKNQKEEKRKNDADPNHEGKKIKKAHLPPPLMGSPDSK